MRRTSHEHEDENQVIFDNQQVDLPQLWEIFKSFFTNFQRLTCRLSKIEEKNRELSKIDLPIVEDYLILVLMLMTRSPRLTLHNLPDANLCNLARYSVFGRIPVGVKIKVHNVFYTHTSIYSKLILSTDGFKYK